MQAKYPISVSVVLSLTLLGGLVWGVQTTLAGNQKEQPSLPNQLAGKDKPGGKPTPVTPGASSPGAPGLSPQGADPLTAPTTPPTGDLIPPTGGSTTPGGTTTAPGATPPGEAPLPGGGILEPSPSPSPLMPGAPKPKPTK